MTCIVVQWAVLEKVERTFRFVSALVACSSFWVGRRKKPTTIIYYLLHSLFYILASPNSSIYYISISSRSPSSSFYKLKLVSLFLNYTLTRIFTHLDNSPKESAFIHSFIHSHAFPSHHYLLLLNCTDCTLTRISIFCIVASTECAMTISIFDIARWKRTLCSSIGSYDGGY